MSQDSNVVRAYMPVAGKGIGSEAETEKLLLIKQFVI